LALLQGCPGPATPPAGLSDHPHTTLPNRSPQRGAVEPRDDADTLQGAVAGAGDSGPDSALVVDVSEPYLPEPGTPASVKGCPQFARRLFDWKTIPELVGRNRSEIVSCYGQPDDPGANPWRYRSPRGCAYEKVETEITFVGDVVQRARARGFITGQHCEFAF
jgi:hypothetical protein